MSSPFLDVRHLAVDYRRDGRATRALTDVSLQLKAGESLAVVGESGSGKSTLARAVMGLLPLAGGSVRIDGEDIHALAPSELRKRRRNFQIVFQDPFASLDPRQTVESSLTEPLEVFETSLDREGRLMRVGAVLERVGLGAAIADRYPHELSGGQCQRVAIARSILLSPKLLVCDEPLSALDVSIQAQIVNLLGELRRDLGLALLFISHNLAVVRRIADRVLVLFQGRVLEEAPTPSLYASPRHPYTRSLLDSVPVPDPRAAKSRAPRTSAASPLVPPAMPGCVFQVRCAFAVERCRREVPALEASGPGQVVACHRWRDIERES